MRLIGVLGINRFIAPQMQPKSIDTTLGGLRSSQEDIDRMPRAAADAAYYMYQLPTYLDTWKSLIAAVATIRGAKPRYQLRADELERIDQPLQFIWGENDVFGNLDVARQATRIIPNAQLHEMQTGHLPFLDQPEACFTVIREFLGEPVQTIEAKRSSVLISPHDWCSISPTNHKRPLHPLPRFDPARTGGAATHRPGADQQCHRGKAGAQSQDGA